MALAAGQSVEVERVVRQRVVEPVDGKRRGGAGPCRDRAHVRVLILRRDAHGQRTREHPSRLAFDRHLLVRQRGDGVLSAADDAGDAEGAADHGGMGGRTADRGHDGAGGDHAVHVLRAGGRAYQDHVVAGCAAGLGRIGVQHDLADADAGACALALGEKGGTLGGAIGEARHEQRAHLFRTDAGQRFVRGDRSLVHQIDRDANGRGGGTRRRAGLQQVERPILYRELDVLNIPVQRFEPPRGGDQGIVRIRERHRQRVPGRAASVAPIQHPRPGHSREIRRKAPARQ